MPWCLLRYETGAAIVVRRFPLFAQGRNDIATVSICKKCIYPKPARTHHCSVCNRWVLALCSVNPSSGPLAVALGQNLDLEFGVDAAHITRQTMCLLCRDTWSSG